MHHERYINEIAEIALTEEKDRCRLPNEHKKNCTEEGLARSPGVLVKRDQILPTLFAECHSNQIYRTWHKDNRQRKH